MGKRFILTTNKRGQVTLPKEVMEHCGLPLGGKLNVEFLPDGTCKFSPIHPLSPATASSNPPSTAPEASSPAATEPSPTPAELTTVLAEPEIKPRSRILASPEELPKASHSVVQTLFVLLQIMYMGFYVGALANLAEIEDLFSPLPKAAQALEVLIVTAAILIPVRAFVLSATLFHAPGAREKLLRIWPFLLPLDELWSLSPFLLLHHISLGLALACMTLLVYSPFAQRSLVLMGAGGVKQEVSATVGGT